MYLGLKPPKYKILEPTLAETEAYMYLCPMAYMYLCPHAWANLYPGVYYGLRWYELA